MKLSLPSPLHPGRLPAQAALLLLLAITAAHAAAQSVPVGSSISASATIAIAKSGTLGEIDLLTQGALNKDFAFASGGSCSLGTAYTAGQSCTVNYTFTPTQPGQRPGAVVLRARSTGVTLSTTPISGLATGPLSTFPQQGSAVAMTIGPPFSMPYAIAVDGNGNVYVADSGKVYEIVAGTNGNAAGTVSAGSTVITVGSGFNNPVSLAVDGAGDLYVADGSASILYEVLAGTGGNPAGVLSAASTVVNVYGSGAPGCVAVDPLGNVFIGDPGAGTVIELFAGTNGNPPGTVSLNSAFTAVGHGYGTPNGLALDANGNLFISDNGAPAVWEAFAGTGGNAPGQFSSASTVTTVAYSSGPSGVAVDAAGNLFFADPSYSPLEALEGTNGNAVGTVSLSSEVIPVEHNGYGSGGVALDGHGHVFAVNTYGDHAAVEYNLVAPLSIYPAAIPSALTVGQIYAPTQTFQPAGGSGGGTIASAGGSLPPGMNLAFVSGNTQAVLSGTPTKPGSYTFVLSATDPKYPITAYQSYTLTVTMPRYTLTNGTFPYAVSGTPYSQSFSIAGSPAGYTLTLTNTAALPPGLIYTASGETVTVAGNPPIVNAFTSYGPFTFDLTDQYGNVQQLGPTGIGVEPAPVVTITPSLAPAAPLYTDSITLNYAVSGNYTNVPNGSIAATLDGVALSTFAVANGAVSLKLGTLPPGTHTLNYSYTGDSFYPALTNQVYTFAVAYPPYTLTGTSTAVSFGGNYDAFDASGNLYTSNTGSNTISKYDTYGNLTTLATTGLNQPTGLAVDANSNLYIADSQNNRIVELSPSGAQTVLPLGTTALSYPTALAFDSTFQNLWIVDRNNGRVVDYNLAAQAIVPANTASGFGNQLSSIAVVPNGTVYAGTVSSYGPGGLFQFSPGTATPTQINAVAFQGVYGLAADRLGTLYLTGYIAVCGNGCSYPGGLYRMDGSGALTLIAPQLAQDPLAVNGQGVVYISGQGYGNQVAFTPGPAGNAGLSPAGEGVLSRPYGGSFRLYFQSPSSTTLTTITPANNSIYNAPSITASSGIAYVDMARRASYPGPQRGAVTATFSDGYQLNVPLYGSSYNTELGVTPGVVTPTATTSVAKPVTSFGGLTVDQNSNAFFTDTATGEVYNTLSGVINSYGFAGSVTAPTQIALDGTGEAYVLSSGTGQIIKHAPNRLVQVAFDLTTQTALASLTAFALDGAGNLYVAGANNNGQGNVYGNGRIIKVNALGGSTSFSTGLVAVPTALAVDANQFVYSGDATGLITQFNHTGAPGALATGLGAVTSLAVEASGTVYATTANSAALTVLSPPVGSATAYTVSTHTVAGVTNALAVAEDGAGTLTVADASGRLFTEVRDAYILYSSANANAGVLTNLNFPATVVGSASPVQSYVLTNTGTTADGYGNGDFGLYLNNLPNPTGFPQSPATTCKTGVEMVAGQTCVLAYTFNPQSPGSDVEGDAINYSTTHGNDVYYTNTYPLFSGTGLSQNPSIKLSASSLQFNNVGIGQSATQIITLTNAGGATLHLKSISLNQTAYTDTSTCAATLASLATCTVSVTFAPTSLGDQPATLTLADDDAGNANSSQQISLDGTGIAAPPYIFVAASAGSLASFYSNGVLHSAATSGGGIGAVVDSSGSVWSLDANGNGVSKFSDAGLLSADFTGVGGVTAARALAIDGTGTVWIANGNGTLSALTNTGASALTVPIASAAGLSAPASISVDTAGSLWIANSGNNTVTEVLGVAAPVTTPLAQSVANNTPGTRP